MVGREDELRLISQLFRAGHRQVTLLGPGGIGKSRLAVAAAQRIAAEQRSSAFFVDLTLAADASHVTPTIAASIDPQALDPASVPDGTESLVVLDNAEHVLQAAADAVETLLAREGTRVLVTSRSPLRLRGERALWLDVLSADTFHSPAVQLLIDRAGLSPRELTDQRRDLERLARRADGLPLVLELLASALRWETAGGLLDHLEETMLDVEDGARDRPVRHMSAKSAIDWSLLQASPAARAGLGALALLRGSFGLDAATELLAAAVEARVARSTLAELVDLSLVQRLAEPGQVTFRILEPIRVSVNRSNLVPPASLAAHRAHAAHYLRRLERVGTTTSEAGRGQPGAALRKDESNLRDALEWSWENDPEAALSAIAPLLAAFSPDQDGGQDPDGKS